MRQSWAANIETHFSVSSPPSVGPKQLFALAHLMYWILENWIFKGTLQYVHVKNWVLCWMWYISRESRDSLIYFSLHCEFWLWNGIGKTWLWKKYILVYSDRPKQGSKNFWTPMCTVLRCTIKCSRTDWFHSGYLAARICLLRANLSNIC